MWVCEAYGVPHIEKPISSKESAVSNSINKTIFMTSLFYTFLLAMSVNWRCLIVVQLCMYYVGISKQPSILFDFSYHM